MTVRRIPYQFTHFRGENCTDGLTDQSIFGRTGQRKLIKLRQYQLIGWGRVKKRYGYQSYITPKINGDAPGQGVAVHKVGTTYNLVAVAGNAIKAMDKTNNTWIDITGTATLTEGQDTLMRWGRFNDGTTQWLLGCNGVDEPIIWDGNTANAVQTLRTKDGSLSAAGVANVVGFDTFHGYPLLLNYAGLKYPGYGTLGYGTGGGEIEMGRGSRPLALHRHSKDVALVFYDEEIYRVEFNPHEGSTWRVLPVEDSEPCISRSSIVTKDGVTYYAGARGIHALKNAHGPSIFVGREIEAFWQALNQSRLPYVSRVIRGAPWNEVVWLVSFGGSTTHDAQIVWNTQLKGWSIWPRSGTDGKNEFNCGASWPDANGIPRTIVVDYNGRAWEAWGHQYSNSGYTDDGAVIESEFETGFLDYGWPGVSHTRALILDIEAQSSKSFTLHAETMEKNPLVKTFTAGTGGEELDVGFMLDETVLSEFTTTHAYTKVNQDGRYMKIKLTESATDPPHVIAGFNLPHKNGGMRMVA